MQTFTNAIMGDLLLKILKTASFDGQNWTDSGQREGSIEGKYVNFLTFTDLEKSVVEDVERIRNHPLVSSDISIYG